MAERRVHWPYESITHIDIIFLRHRENLIFWLASTFSYYEKARTFNSLVAGEQISTPIPVSICSLKEPFKGNQKGC